MFRPTYGQIASEACLDPYGWTTDTGQLLDGTLRLMPTTGKLEASYTNLIEKTWDTTWDFEDSDVTDWFLFGNYEVKSGSVRLHAERDYSVNLGLGWNLWYGLAQVTGSPLSSVSNTNGWSVDTTVFLEGVVRFVFDDGTKQIQGRMGEQNGVRGIWLQSPSQNSEDTGDFMFPIDDFGNVYAASTTVYDSVSKGVSKLGHPITERNYKTIRFSVKGNDLTIDIGDQELHLSSTTYLQTGGTKGFSFFMNGNYQKVKTETEYLYKKIVTRVFAGRGDIWIDEFKLSTTHYQPVREIGTTAETLYPTVTQTAYSPAFTPDPGVTMFRNVLYEVDNATGDGTLFVTPQYSYNGGGWADGSQIQLTGDYTQSLVSFQPIGDGLDSVRFKAEQVSNDGTGGSPRLDKMSIVTSRRDNGVYTHTPAWGPSAGANTVALDIVRAPQGLYFGTGDQFILGMSESAIEDQSPNAITVNTQGTVTLTDDYLSLFAYTAEITTAPFDGTILATTGDPGDGLTVSGVTTEVVERRHPKTTDAMYMQHITGTSAAHYVRIDDIGSLSIGTVYVLEFVLWTAEGQVDLQIPGTGYASSEFPKADSKLVRVAFEATSTSQEVTFYADSADADFYVGGFRLYSGTAGYLDCGVNSEINDLTHFNVYGKVFMNAYPSNNVALAGNHDGTNGWMLYIDSTGRPSLKMGTTKIEGESIVPLDAWTTVAARVEPDFVEVLLNGETSAIGEPTFDAGTGEFYIGNSTGDPVFPGSIAEARVSSEDWTAAEIAYHYDRNVIPTFECAYEPELDSDTLVYLTFNNSRGVIENKGSLNNPVIPDLARRWIYRGVTGTIGSAIRIFKDTTHHGAMHIPLFSDTSWLNSSYAIEGDVWWSEQGVNQTLVSVGGGADFGFQVRKTAANKLQYHYKDSAGERTVTSTGDIATTAWKHFSIHHDRSDNSVTMKIDGLSDGTLASDATGTIGYTGDIYIGDLKSTGEGSWVHLDNFKIQGNATGEYSEAYPWTTKHWTPSQTVYVDGDALHVGRVDHVSPYRKLVVMPSHAAGEISTRIVGSEYLPIEPYNYVFNYKVELDTGEYESLLGSTRSPFRVMSKPLDHSLKIAMIGTTPISVDTHMSLTDLSDRSPANRTGYGVPIKMLSGSAIHSYSDAADTSEVLVSNRSAMWQVMSSPKPLFHKYLIGRAKRYVYVPTAATTGDVDPIRQAIKLSYVNNDPVEMAWDIEVSNLDYYGETLPSNVYSVVLLMESVPGRTMWVHYPSVHFRALEAASDNSREIVNPVPLFGDHAGRMGVIKTINELGSYDIEVEV